MHIFLYLYIWIHSYICTHAYVLTFVHLHVFCLRWSSGVNSFVCRSLCIILILTLVCTCISAFCCQLSLLGRISFHNESSFHDECVWQIVHCFRLERSGYWDDCWHYLEMFFLGLRACSGQVFVSSRARTSFDVCPRVYACTVCIGNSLVLEWPLAWLGVGKTDQTVWEWPLAWLGVGKTDQSTD